MSRYPKKVVVEVHDPTSSIEDVLIEQLVGLWPVAFWLLAEEESLVRGLWIEVSGIVGGYERSGDRRLITIRHVSGGGGRSLDITGVTTTAMLAHVVTDAILQMRRSGASND